MHDDDDVLYGALELMVDANQREQDGAAVLAEQTERARSNADAARLALAELAEPACEVIAARLHGITEDRRGVAITKDREDSAWEVLSRIGVPKLRATAIAASYASHAQAPAPGAPGWVAPEVGEAGAAEELDPATVDAQIESFLAGAKAARDLGTDRGGSPPDYQE